MRWKSPRKSRSRETLRAQRSLAVGLLGCALLTQTAPAAALDATEDGSRDAFDERVIAALRTMAEHDTVLDVMVSFSLQLRGIHQDILAGELVPLSGPQVLKAKWISKAFDRWTHEAGGTIEEASFGPVPASGVEGIRASFVRTATDLGATLGVDRELCVLREALDTVTPQKSEARRLHGHLCAMTASIEEASHKLSVYQARIGPLRDVGRAALLREQTSQAAKPKQGTVTPFTLYRDEYVALADAIERLQGEIKTQRAQKSDLHERLLAECPSYRRERLRILIQTDQAIEFLRARSRKRFASSFRRVQSLKRVPGPRY